MRSIVTNDRSCPCNGLIAAIVRPASRTRSSGQWTLIVERMPVAESRDGTWSLHRGPAREPPPPQDEVRRQVRVIVGPDARTRRHPRRLPPRVDGKLAEIRLAPGHHRPDRRLLPGPLLRVIRVHVVTDPANQACVVRL